VPQTLARKENTVVADKGKRVEVVGYMRTSSATNVGDGKDSEARQRKAIEGYAEASGGVIVDWFYDAAVSGADPIEVRPGFAELLARIADNGVRTIIVETANRFARDLMVQEVGYAMLRGLGVTLVAADSPSSLLRRRSAIEPVIGHMKTDGHLGRCHLKGREGDAANVILTAVGHNLRRILAWLRVRALLRLILLALWRAFAPVPAVRWAS
jgi:hypothetical protein